MGALDCWCYYWNSIDSCHLFLCLAWIYGVVECERWYNVISYNKWVDIVWNEYSKYIGLSMQEVYDELKFNKRQHHPKSMMLYEICNIENFPTIYIECWLLAEKGRYYQKSLNNTPCISLTWNCKNREQFENTLCHEYCHFIDDIRSNGKFNSIKYNDNVKTYSRNIKRYYNSWAEINAYIHTYYKKKKLDPNLDVKSEPFFNNLTEKHKRHVIGRLHTNRIYSYIHI